MVRIKNLFANLFLIAGGNSVWCGRVLGFWIHSQTTQNGQNRFRVKTGGNELKMYALCGVCIYSMYNVTRIDYFKLIQCCDLC